MQDLDLDALARQFGGTAGTSTGRAGGAGPVGSGTPAPSQPSAPERSWADTAIDSIPWLGGMAGGMVGGAGGTVLGAVVGGVPGAVGGAALGGAAGESIKQLLDTYRGHPKASSSDAAQAIGEQALIQGGSELAGIGIAKGATSLGSTLMQQAVKPSQRLAAEFRTSQRAISDTLLKEGVNVTPKGVEKLKTLLGATQADLRQALREADATGATISPQAVAQRVDDASARAMKQVNPSADLGAIEDVRDEFLHHPGYPGQYPIQSKAQAAMNPQPKVTRPLMPSEAQDMKVGTYQQLAGKYGEVSSAQAEAQKALARGLREEIEKSVPTARATNQREAQLLAALEATGRQAALAGNKSSIGLAWLANHPLNFLTAIMDRNPAAKSLIARGMYSQAGQASKVDPQMIRLAIAALGSSQDEP